MRVLVLVAALVALAAGAGCFVAGLAGGRGELMKAGSTILVAALALLGVAAGLETWREERRRTRSAQTREIYSDLMRQILSRFTGRFELAQESLLRADVVTWASPEVVVALRDWNQVYDALVPPNSPQGVGLRLSADAQEKIRAATAAVVKAIRADLGAGDASLQEIEGALFNATQASRPNPS